MSLRVAFAVGDSHTLHCGVKDYANTLTTVLRQEGVQADVVAPLEGWGSPSVKAFCQWLTKEHYDIVHVQYPSVGNRASLWPHILPLMKSTRASVVTLHEHSALPVAQRLSTQLFRYTANAVILTTGFERESFNGILKGRGASQQIISIGSNIPGIQGTATSSNAVVYFGQIRRNKGLKQFLEVAECGFSARTNFNFHVVGSVSAANQEYAKQLRERASSQVKWSFDASFEEVAAILHTAFATYLPFPDGASERRGSMLAALLNGSPVLSTFGPATTLELRRTLLQAESPQDALRALNRLSMHPGEREELRRASLEYAKRHDWSTIARQHVAIYKKLLD